MTRALAVAWAPLALGVVLVGCNCGPKVSATGTDVSVSPTTLDFGNVWVGASSTLPVRAHNGSMSPTSGTLSALTGTGFSLPSQTVDVEGGTTANLLVTFTPSDAGAVQGSFVFTDDAFTQTVQLTANGVTPGACASPTACLTFAFDFDAGACTSRAEPDGEACADSCVDGGVCRNGLCSGTAIDCDDGNACTADGCGATGCLHVDTSGSCLASNEDCQAAACDPKVGCTSVTVADGVSCGSNDCTTAHVCIAGTCVERPAVNGSVCQAATPCMGVGMCNAGACSQGAITVLAPEWEYLSPNGSVPSALALDADDNVYFTESDGGPTGGALVSLSPDGGLRFKSAGFELQPSPAAPVVDVAVGQVYVTSGFTVAAVSFDGLIRWRVAPNLDDFSVRWHDLVLSGEAGLLVMIGDEGDGGSSSVTAVNRATGAPGFSQATSFASSAFGDGEGNFLISNIGSSHARLELIEANGQPEWSAPIMGDTAAAVLALGGDTIVIESLSTTNQLQTLSLVNHGTPRPLFFASRTQPFTSVVMDSTTLWAEADTLMGFDLATGTGLQLMGSSLVTVIAPTVHGLVYAEVPDFSGMQTLFDSDRAGNNTYCPLATGMLDLIIVPGHVLGHTARGVVSYSFPNVAPTSGWVTARGSAQRDGQAH